MLSATRCMSAAADSGVLVGIHSWGEGGRRERPRQPQRDLQPAP